MSGQTNAEPTARDDHDCGTFYSAVPALATAILAALPAFFM